MRRKGIRRWVPAPCGRNCWCLGYAVSCCDAATHRGLGPFVAITGRAAVAGAAAGPVVADASAMAGDGENPRRREDGNEASDGSGCTGGTGYN